MAKKIILSVSGDCGEKLVKAIKKKFDSIKVSRVVRERKRHIKRSVMRKNEKAAGIFRHRMREEEGE